ncbi:DUF2130 domain-containing protein [uncultured Phascolarctobacterium sp.]|jgi:hypothetical protein|uniref:DUF2130 domain-containing protein n=1 Tax=uncultured Phascolarctobacterium sp. TaxID=512296 RepID=UPI0025F39A5E|nr:DUF2130 domain-containing protein [uncultured Phascolarctobacterium sp.]
MQEIKCPKCGEVFQVDEAGYAAIVKQVRDKEFNRELKERELQFTMAKEDALEVARTKAEKDFNQLKAEKDRLVSELNAKLTAKDEEQKHIVKEAEAEKDKVIAELSAQITNNENAKNLAVIEVETRYTKLLAEKKEEIAKLNGDLESANKELEIRVNSIRREYDVIIKNKDEQIEQYRDFKARQSTKMIGESLEVHCSNEFNKVRPIGFPTAYFEKDNDARSGSKGDFIFRDFDNEGNEYISIMFEMKNEADATEKKHKNEDFFKELDKDRREKNCEYAVLVTLLEADNDYYNQGIVDVSHRYPKMYVIRPQFFIPLISLLRNAARNSLEYRKQLAEMKNQNIDIENFEAGINEFKRLWGMHYTNAKNRFDEAIAEIDKTMQHLQKVRDALVTSGNHLGKANTQAADLTIKRLTKGNPTMAQKFAELKEQ